MTLFELLVFVVLIAILIFGILSYRALSRIDKQNCESLELAKKSIKDNQDQYKKNEALRKISAIRANLYDELDNLEYDKEEIDNVLLYTNKIIAKYNGYLADAGLSDMYDFNDEKYRIIGIVNKYTINGYLNSEIERVDEESKEK